jgi:hypothetical protein
VVGVIVHLPFLTRAVCLPVLARLWIPGERDHTPLLLARELVDLVCGHLGDHPVHLVGDAAYIGKPLRGLPKQEPHGPCGTARRWVKLGAGAACGRRFGLVLCA